MAIVKSFGGASILKPGAYSQFKVDNSAGSPLAPTNVMMLIGEAEKGAPGSSDGIQAFQASQLSDLLAKYGSGPICDAAVAATRPSNTPGVGGAGQFLIYKTNASTQASATLLKSSSPMFVIKDSGWGAPGNELSIVVSAGDTGKQVFLSVPKLGGTTESLGENAASPVLSIHYTGNGTAATATVSGATRQSLTLTTSLTGQSDSSVNLSIPLAGKTMSQLVDAINGNAGYVASMVTIPLSATPATDLDPMSATSILTSLSVYRLQKEILAVLNTSARIQATEATQPLGGVPSVQSLPLTGGAQGASTNSDFSNGLADSLAQIYQVCVPCVSRDASVDIADTELGFTDAASTYTIASVIAALNAHLTLRGEIKNRREAQGMVGFRNSSKATCFSTIAGISSYNIQAAMQDVVFVDATGNLKVGQPHIFAAMAAGIRLGTQVGTPLTFKTLQAVNVGHFIDPVTLLPTGDFNPQLDVDVAIESGVLFTEPNNSSFRIVVDNTTYGIDSSFVFNRGSVVEASYYTMQTLRATAEQLFVGNKISNGLASSIKNALINKLRELNQPDVQIITSSSDAPEGFRLDTFVVSIQGNTCTVQLEFKPVQGLDFVFFNFTLGDITQSA
jgi:hypothetical protein